MNKPRRERIRKLIEEARNLQEELGLIKEEEENAFYNLPESIQSSDRGETMEEGISSLDQAFDTLDECCDALEEAINR